MTSQESSFKSMSDRELIAAAKLLIELVDSKTMPDNRDFDRYAGFEIHFDDNSGDVYFQNSIGQTYGLLPEEAD